MIPYHISCRIISWRNRINGCWCQRCVVNDDVFLKRTLIGSFTGSKGHAWICLNTLPHVLLKGRRDWEGHVTEATSIDIFPESSMSFHVSRKFATLSTSIRTQFTLVGFFSSMWSAMNSEVGAIFEHFPAVFTGIIPSPTPFLSDYITIVWRSISGWRPTWGGKRRSRTRRSWRWGWRCCCLFVVDPEVSWSLNCCFCQESRRKKQMAKRKEKL